MKSPEITEQSIKLLCALGGVWIVTEFDVFVLLLIYVLENGKMNGHGIAL